MDDNQEVLEGLVPSFESLYEGEAIAEADVNENYHNKNDVVFESKGGHGSASDPFAHLSAELNTNKYRIRSPQQQEDWTRKKTRNTKDMAKYLLRMKNVAWSLVELARTHPKKLFGKFSEIDGKIGIEYDPDYCDYLADMLESYLNGESSDNIIDIAEIIVEDYNVSYANFTKNAYLEMRKRFSVTKEEHIQYMNEVGLGDSASQSGSVVTEGLESDTGLDWSVLNSAMRSLTLLFTSSEQLKERLVSTNLRMGLRTAITHYHDSGGRKNVNFDEKDLLSEAATGLMHAADMFVHGTSARFTTYAEYWITLKVTRYAKDNNTVRVPVHVSDMVYSIVRVLRQRDNESSGSSEPLTREEAMEILGKKISTSVWTLAQNKYSGQNLAVSCVTNDGEDEENSFDIFVGGKDVTVETHESMDCSRIMDTAKSLVRDDASPKDRKFLTPEQFVFLKMHFVDDLKNPEIAQLYAGKKGGVSAFGKVIDSKYVRTEIMLAIDKIRLEMGVKL
jgi:DNA-directed RNA polymerase sigma subunit (sigma70/sigma32)